MISMVLCHQPEYHVNVSVFECHDFHAQSDIIPFSIA
jgi:hypothetical protein